MYRCERIAQQPPLGSLDAGLKYLDQLWNVTVAGAFVNMLNDVVCSRVHPSAQSHTMSEMV